jgi:hypothetical protein
MKSQSKKRTTCNQEVFVEVAKELGLSPQVVKEIFNSFSAFTRSTMESNTFDGVRWPFLGVFKSKPIEVQVLNQLRGITPEEQKQFKQAVRSGKYKRKRLGIDEEDTKGPEREGSEGSGQNQDERQDLDKG